MWKVGEGGVLYLDKATVVLEPDMASTGGLFVPKKDRVVFKPPEKKSALGLDVLAVEKRESKDASLFKFPRERNISNVSSLEEEESSSSGLDELLRERHHPYCRGASERNIHHHYRGTSERNIHRHCRGVSAGKTSNPGPTSSPWDYVSPYPVPIRASGSSRRVSTFHKGPTSSPWDFVSPSPVPVRASGSSRRVSTFHKVQGCNYNVFGEYLLLNLEMGLGATLRLLYYDFEGAGLKPPFRMRE